MSDKSTILAELEKAEVFRIYVNGDHITITEWCDMWYSMELSKDQLGELISELTLIHDGLKDKGE